MAGELRPERSERVRIVVADDHPTTRRGIGGILGGLNMDVVGEAEDGRSALRLCQMLQPDVALLDMFLPHLNGVEVVTQLCRELPAAKAVIYSMNEDPWLVREALAAGARGYVCKTSPPDQLRMALSQVARGGTYVDSAMSDRHARPGWRLNEPKPGASLLSKRELEVLQLLARGLPGKEIADTLALSPRTLETYRARAMHKLQLRSRVDLMRFALHSGWLS
jgi:DNA-binding NarL/FixJ family response regulator